MVKQIDSRWRHGAATVALSAALVLGGCNRATELTQQEQAAQQQEAGAARLPDLPATLPLSAGEATPAAYAPAVDALPDVAPVRAVRVADSGRSYAYADTAYDFADALGDAPPDYAFDYEGTDPWAWQGYDDSQVFAEPVADGYRYYYYRSGADAPYFVRDPDYGYGYDGGNLAVVYANDGAIVPWADYGPRIVYASRYLNRGRNLYRASRARRQPVIAANWNARRPAILQSRRAWAEARVQQPGWATYRQRYNRDAPAYWRPEAQRREADARRFASWQARDFRTPPPPRAIPAAWQKASWARDERRFAPPREERRAILAARQDPARFDAQRRQAIAARDQALAARQQRLGDRREDAARQQANGQRRETLGDRREQQARQQAQRQQAQGQRQNVAQVRQQREARAQAQQARASQQAQGRQAQTRQAQTRQAQAQRAQAQRAQAGQARQTRLAERQQAQAQRAQAGAQRQQRDAQKAERTRTNQARQSQVAERQQREQARAAQQAQRNQANQARQSQVAERQQREQARAAQQAQRNQANQARQSQVAERQQREQARAAQQAQRNQANQARQSQAAERQQRAQAQAAQQAQRAQADQARQAQQAQRAQAGQARAARQQEQAARQQQRAEQKANRPERGGGRER